jgi:T5SS/PEP-CTERM-associated repeat protein
VFAASASAGVVYQSATLGPTGQAGGATVNSDVFVGVRFQLTAPATADRVGGHMFRSAGGNNQFFGALVQLSGQFDFPDSPNLSTPDVLRTATIAPPPSFNSNDAFGTFAPVALAPGWYAVVVGSGLFGATGVGAMVTNNSLVGSPSFLRHDADGTWVSTTPSGLRFVLAGPASRSWANAANGTWDVAANWSAPEVPESIDEAVFDHAGATYEVSLPTGASVGKVSVKSDTVTLALGGNTLTAGNVSIGNGAAPAKLWLRNGTLAQGSTNEVIAGDLSAGILEMSDSATLSSPFGTLIVGRKTAGAANVANSTINTAYGRIGDDPASSPGALSGGDGTVNLNGGATWNVSNQLFIGRNGPGKININPGGTVNVSNGTTVFNTTGTEVRLQGGTLKTRSFSTSGNPGHFVWTSGTLWIDASTLFITPFASSTIGSNVTLTPAMTLRAGGLNMSPVGASQLNVAGGALTVDFGAVNDNTFTQTGGVTTIANEFDNQTVGAGSLGVTGGTFTADRVRQQSLSVGGTGVVTIRSPNGGTNSTSRVASLSITSSGKLDLKENKLIVAGGAVGSATGGTYNGVSGMIQSAQNGGTWDGPRGITTTLPAAQSGLTSLAVATADQTGYAGGTFGGVSVANGDVLVMYTYGGDANLDGLVSGDDYSAIDFNILVPGASGWYNGDFNYDGVISGDDYSAIDFNILAQGAPFPIGSRASAGAVTVVPEPTEVSAFALAASVWVWRQRRKPLHTAM